MGANSLNENNVRKSCIFHKNKGNIHGRVDAISITFVCLLLFFTTE